MLSGNVSFTYGYIDFTTSWTAAFGPCNASTLHYQWSIPSDLTVTSDHDFVLVASNITESHDSPIFETSSPFLIEPISSTTTSTATSSTAESSSIQASTQSSESTATTSPARSPPTSKGLSTGTTAGIGVGAGLGTILLLVGLWLFLRKRRQNKATVPSSSTPGHEKPELADTSKSKPAVEADGTEMADICETGVRNADEEEVRPPAELPTERWR